MVPPFSYSFWLHVDYSIGWSIHPPFSDDMLRLFPVPVSLPGNLRCAVCQPIVFSGKKWYDRKNDLLRAYFPQTAVCDAKRDSNHNK